MVATTRDRKSIPSCLPTITMIFKQSVEHEYIYNNTVYNFHKEERDINW